MNESKKTISIHVDASEVDVTTAKVERLVSLLKEANSLADELASGEITLREKAMDNLRKETIATLEKLVPQLNKDDNMPQRSNYFVDCIKVLTALLDVIER